VGLISDLNLFVVCVIARCFDVEKYCDVSKRVALMLENTVTVSKRLENALMLKHIVTVSKRVA